jgi:hypothetical protein
MDTLDTKNEQNEQDIFICEKCDYKCFRKSNYDRHLATDKHKWIHFGYILDTKTVSSSENEQHHIWTQNGNSLDASSEKEQAHNKGFECTCGKKYKYSQGLSKHKKVCKNIIPSEVDEPTDKDLIMMLIKENADLKHLVLDVCQKIQPLNNTVNSHNVTNNKTFNLNVFLNETCKDAMNIMDFVDSLKIQLSDLENVGKLGFIDGISKIIVKNLNSLDETKRPVHCTDTKREVMYIKDEDKWEKENENKQKMRKVIKHVTHKNSKLLKEYKAKYQGCEKSDSKYSDQYDKLIIEAMGGKGDNDIEKEDKIIRNIAKTVTIDKSGI